MEAAHAELSGGHGGGSVGARRPAQPVRSSRAAMEAALQRRPHLLPAGLQRPHFLPAGGLLRAAASAPTKPSCAAASPQAPPGGSLGKVQGAAGEAASRSSSPSSSAPAPRAATESPRRSLHASPSPAASWGGAAWEKKVRASARVRRPRGYSVLVTGAAGFVGCHAAAALRRRGDGVLGLDKARPRVSSLLAPSPPRDRLPPGGWLGREAVAAVAHQEKEEGVRRREKGRGGGPPVGARGQWFCRHHRRGRTT
jgi:hypothetical protein